MKLTERQRWDVIRAMVKQKNDEYSAFLLKFFDQKQMSQIVGITRNEFWDKCRGNKPNPMLRNQPVSQASSSWLDDLSSEDLLIFLDYRCNLLQMLYKYYKMNRTLDKAVIKSAAQNTPVNKLIAYNDGYLMHTGKPARAKDEIKVKDLNLSEEQLKREALAQTMGVLASTYAQVKKVDIIDSKKLASKMVTYNANPDGLITGYQFKGEVSDCSPLNISKIELEDSAKTSKETDLKLYGFDGDGMPVFSKKGKLVNLIGESVDRDRVVYDSRKRKMEQDFDAIEEKAKHVGFDGEGRPVYQYKNDYYNSIGQLVEEDEILPNYEDDFSF